MSATKAVATTAEERKRAGLAARELQAQADRALLARIMPVVGRNIAQRRETLGLSQRALSDQASVDRIFLRGVKPANTPTVVFLAKIAPRCRPPSLRSPEASGRPWACRRTTPNHRRLQEGITAWNRSTLPHQAEAPSPPPRLPT